jgi:hypothetical protein
MRGSGISTDGASSGFNQGQPSMHIGNGGDGQGVGTVTDVTVSGNTIINSLYGSIGFSTSTDITLEDNTIIYPGRNGIVISPPFYPAPTGSAAITANSVSAVQSGDSAFLNDSSGFTATANGNSWQLTASETRPSMAPRLRSPEASRHRTTIRAVKR